MTAANSNTEGRGPLDLKTRIKALVTNLAVVEPAARWKQPNLPQSNQRPAGTGNRASVHKQLAGTDSLGCLLLSDTRLSLSCCQPTGGQPELKILHQSNQRPAGTGNRASVHQRPAGTGPGREAVRQSTCGQLELPVSLQPAGTDNFAPVKPAASQNW